MNEKTISPPQSLEACFCFHCNCRCRTPGAQFVQLQVRSVGPETYEIIVVGAGGVGIWPPLIKAAQKAPSTLWWLGEAEFPGGNTLISQGFINAADPVRQPKLGLSRDS